MADELIKVLDLSPHPYGGYFKEIHRSSTNVKPLNDDRDARSAATYIQLVMKHNDIDPWHKMKSEETFFYHKGSYLKLFTIDSEGKLEYKVVGDTVKDPDAVYAYMYVIPAGVWFAGELVDKHPDSFGLFSVAVSPGFHFDDSEVGDVDKLRELFPEHKEVIERLSITHVHHDDNKQE